MNGNSNYSQKCPIWGTMAAEHWLKNDENEDWHEQKEEIVDSPRAGGKFSISAHDKKLLSRLQEIDVSVKARLTSWLIEQRRLGEEFPEVSCDSIENAKVRRPRRVTERADNFLRYLAELGKVSDEYLLRSPNYQSNLDRFLCSLAHIESVVDISCNQDQQDKGQSEINQYLEYIDKKKWIRVVSESTAGSLMYMTLDGHIRLEELNYIISFSSQAFMAMWFDPSMDEVWKQGFEPGIKRSGYDPVRIDQKQHVNKIDDEIISEIRRSRFVVADFTQGETEARGGVYYEAGFAHGLGIPVIFTCQRDWLKKIHFDIRQYNCITWERDDLKKLQEDLANRITAILGDGPGRSAS